MTSPHPGINLLSNQQWMARYGTYLQVGDEIIHAKVTDGLAALIDSFDIESQIESMLRQFDDMATGYSLENGVAFVFPYETLVPLPPGYSSNRISVQEQEVRIVQFLNFSTTIHAGSLAARIGHCFAIVCVFGLRPTPLNAIGALNRGVEYANDILGAYSLARHDHGIYTLTLGTLPSYIRAFEVDAGNVRTIKFTGAVRPNGQDVADRISKRVLIDDDELQRFRRYSEELPLRPAERYLANLMRTCITKLCLQDYDGAVLDSGRFAELALRLVASRISSLKPEETVDNQNLFTRGKNARPGLLNHIARELKFTGSHKISLWTKNARDLRNRLTHGLLFETISGDQAHAAVKADLELVQLAVEKLPDADWNIKVLAVGANIYGNIFSHRTTKSQRNRQQGH
ncbi:hypothetical protein [Arthrobacter sp. P2b]|uniref:hypothetical protein n=1 Tax=Arthrobacter sp. P2b TaxID=1938741 RepID=UPI0009C5DA53|nr:hypothetical protein [Arthrobacter sp. P2b]SLK12055.1 hypothetical protein SAMN06272721_1169 [Arthrobacter sp. P2b]